GSAPRTGTTRCRQTSGPVQHVLQYDSRPPIRQTRHSFHFSRYLGCCRRKSFSTGILPEPMDGLWLVLPRKSGAANLYTRLRCKENQINSARKVIAARVPGLSFSEARNRTEGPKTVVLLSAVIDR